jgi:hypothetical protein
VENERGRSSGQKGGETSECDGSPESSSFSEDSLREDSLGEDALRKEESSENDSPEYSGPSYDPTEKIVQRKPFREGKIA